MALVLVTGANRGIGLELVRQLRARGDEVIAGVRRGASELAATGAVVLPGLELQDPEGIQAWAQALGPILGDRALDLVIHNAGILEQEPEGVSSPESVRRQFEVNALGPLLLTDALRPYLRSGGKLAFVSSRMGSLTGNSSGGYRGYRMSKAALNMGAVNLALELAPRGIAVVVLHPGYVRTGMTGGQGAVDADWSAQRLIARIDELSLAGSGSFWHADGTRLPW